MTKSATAQFLAAAIDHSGLTQREIARRIGLAKPNVISMMKNGETKVPIDRIPALAKACDADPKDFLRVAMTEYHPEMWDVLYIVFDPKLTDPKIDLLRMLKQADPKGEIAWKKPDAQVLVVMFRYILNWMQYTSDRKSK